MNKQLVNALQVTIELAERYNEIVPKLMAMGGIDKTNLRLLKLLGSRKRAIQQTKGLLKSLQVFQPKKGKQS